MARAVEMALDGYVVLEQLAEGGMGAIYRAKKVGPGGFEREVVLKHLLPELTDEPELIELFLREARLGATLDHANIIHTIDLVRSDADYFIVMEYVRGANLRAILRRARRRRRRLAPAAALYVAHEVLAGLAHAHAKTNEHGEPLGLIHRDVSPSNILVSAAGEVKLSDFGIAKATQYRSNLYKVKGKLGYMSPEQAQGRPLAPRSDVYSLAVCLYEMLTGERLLVATSLHMSAAELYAQPIPPVSDKVPGLPMELNRILARALAVVPEERIQSAGELGEELLRVAYRGGLLVGAHDLARHLVDVCGPVDEWGLDGRAPTAEESGAAVDGPGTERIPLADLDVPDLDESEDDDRSGPDDT